MLTRAVISQIQKENNYTQSSSDISELTNIITLEKAVDRCQEYILKKQKREMQQLTSKERKQQYEKMIMDYVDKEKPDVVGFIDIPNGLSKLKAKLIEEITEYGPITEILTLREDIDEIRINDIDNIWIECGGISKHYPAEFSSIEQLRTVIAKLIRNSKKRLMYATPMVNARTFENYRVNATHEDLSRNKCPVVVIRKFKKTRYTPKQLVDWKCLSDNMLKMLKLVPGSESSWITVGATGSGKTTLNEMTVKFIKKGRIITIENPSEMDLIAQQGQPKNDVVQYESVTVENEDDPDAPTMQHLIENAMRQSPKWIGPGELRTPAEFHAALMAAQTGHYFFTTLHAETAREALYRYLTAYLTKSNEPAELALRNICSAIKFIIVQQKLADGRRKVVEISEIVGAEGLNAVVNQIYVFETIDSVVNEETGEVMEIIGKHKRVGCITKETQERMKRAGIRPKDFNFLVTPVEKDREEVYTYGQQGVV